MKGEDYGKLAQSSEYQTALMAFKEKDYGTAAQQLHRLVKAGHEKVGRLQHNLVVSEFYMSLDPKPAVTRLCELLAELGKRPRKGPEEEDQFDERKEGALIRFNAACMLLFLGKGANVLLLLKDILTRRGDTFYFKSFKLLVTNMEVQLRYQRVAEAERLLAKLHRFKFISSKATEGLALRTDSALLAGAYPLVTCRAEVEFLVSYYLGIYGLAIHAPSVTEAAITSAQACF
jgi:hypothetical protein